MSLNSIFRYFSISKPSDTICDNPRKLSITQWSVFLSATLGYGIYYVCRLSLNVLKKPLVDSGLFDEKQLGIIGSVLFFSYAVGKFVNGFLADRSNIRRFFSLGLLITAIVNLVLGFTTSFWVFAILWGISGWFQSMGAASCVVGLTRWFPDNKRGRFYGFWSASHNLGEALTFITIASVVSVFDWRMGFVGAAIMGFVGVFLILIFMKDTPESIGLYPVNKSISDNINSKSDKDNYSYSKAQKETLLMPAIWILAFSSAFMYISRYAINSWGIFYLENQKGYSTVDASFIISLCPIFGIIGTILSGWISDKVFKSNRNVPALIFGILNTIALSLFLLVPGTNKILDIAAMILFGVSIGVLICFLGGLMAVDIAPKKASGAALGIVGVSSYIGAGVQDIISGYLIEGHKYITNGVECYDFTYINWFWIGASIVSTLLTLLVWKKSKNIE